MRRAVKQTIRQAICHTRGRLISNIKIKFEYSREIRDSITGRVHKAGLMRKHSLIS